VQSDASRKRRRLAIGLVVAGLVMILAPVLANVVAPGVPWVAWLACSLPAALVIAGGLVWYRSDKVFDRGFEPDESPDNTDR
jgi:peptidoglycan/LPS O-acetylase OafA/YrhL